MTTPSGCSAWAAVEDLPAAVLELHDDTTWCTYLGMATDILWAATGRRWRGAVLSESVVLRAAPSPPDTGFDTSTRWAWHASWGSCCFGGWGPAGPRWLPSDAHHEPRAVRLPRPDVVSVTSVTVDGDAFAAFELDGSWLSRTDGWGWPVCRDRVTVAYQYGREAPSGGRSACVELAAEIGRSASSQPDRASLLPRRVQTVTRQGITFAALDDLEFLDKGLTGLTTVDLWIRSVNPKGRARRAAVWSPDLPYARRTS